MSIRQLKLPGDLPRIAEIAAETWNYPDHPEWNVQPDEEESMADSMENYQRIWPFIRIIQVFSPGLRDFLHGHVWEEEGRIAGFTQIHRRGSTDTWYISAVGVHPDFRRRGIAQQLVERGLDLIRQRDGLRLLLDVIEGNVPAVQLYAKMGFETISSNMQLEIQPRTISEKLEIPPGYKMETTDDYAWRPRFELMKRITPQSITRFEPVEEGRFKKPFLTRLVFPLLKRAEGGLEVNRFVINNSENQIVAYAMYDTHTRDKGRNTIMAELDPEHPGLANFLINHMLKKVFDANPDKVVELNLPDWQGSLIDSAVEAGFELRAKLLTLGLLIQA